jgi:hypothetical protein
MEQQKQNQAQFSKKMDQLVQNVISQNVGTPEFRAEYVKATNLYRRVAEYDVQLAQELLLSTFMFAYTFAIGTTEKIFRR